MNNLERHIIEFVESTYNKKCEVTSVFSVGKYKCQFIWPTRIVESIWYHRDQEGFDIREIIDLVDDNRYSTDNILSRMDYYYGVDEVIDIIKEGYSISGIAELSNFDPWSMQHFIVIIYTEKECRRVKVCDYRNKIEYPEEKDNYDDWKFVFTDRYFKDYLNQVYGWLLQDTNEPKDGPYSSFYYCDYEDIPYFFEHFNPRLLSPEKMHSRKELHAYYKAGKTKTLGELSKIIYPKIISKESSYYPIPEVISALLPKNISGGDVRKNLGNKKTVYEQNVRTDTQLHKGDYYIGSSEPINWFPVLEEPTEPVYAEGTSCVVRTTGIINLEYLFLYFNNDVGRMAVDILSTRDIKTRSDYDNIELIQVVLPTKEHSYYTDMVLDNYYENYHYINNRMTYRQQEELLGINSDSDLIQLKYFQFANLGRRTNLRRMILLDIDEVYRCIGVEAYKAAIILCGGILEAVLTDWISEIDHINYFNKTGFDSRLRVSLFDGTKYFLDKRGKKTNPDLFRIIDRIDGLEPPVWINNEKQFATIIRESRNKVHASLAISDPNITEEQCRKVLDYLIIVLKTRGLYI